jgi:hypothetical protein
MVLPHALEEHHMTVPRGAARSQGSESGFSQGRRQTPFWPPAQQPLVGSLNPQNACLLCNAARHFASVQSPVKAHSRVDSQPQRSSASNCARLTALYQHDLICQATNGPLLSSWPRSMPRGTRSPSPSTRPDAVQGLPHMSEQRSAVPLGNGASPSSPNGPEGIPRSTSKSGDGW